MIRSGLAQLILAALVLGAAPVGAQDRLLFVGNSYTFYSGGLEAMVDSLLQEATGASVDTRAVTAGGYRLNQHLADADGTNGDRPLRQALVTGDNTEWDLVVLQDQSQIPGFPMSQPEWIDSRDAAAALDDLIEPTGAETMFFLTWGRRDGDSRNPGRFPDFPTMQGYLTAGYEAYRDAASSEDRPTYIAPVGVAFELVYDDVIGAGAVPEDSGSSFHRLYAGDGSHPSTEGSYLAACVMFAAYTGLSPESLEWAPASLDVARQEYLQSIAAEAVFEATADWLYPIADEPGEDTGPGDVGPDTRPDDVGSDDVGSDDVGSDDVGPDVGADIGEDAADVHSDLDTSDVDTEPSDTEPSDTEPSDTAPSDTAPSDTAPSDAAEADTADAATDAVADLSVADSATEDAVGRDAAEDSTADVEAEDGDVNRSPSAASDDGGCSSARGSGLWFSPILGILWRRRRSAI